MATTRALNVLRTMPAVRSPVCADFACNMMSSPPGAPCRGPADGPAMSCSARLVSPPHMHVLTSGHVHSLKTPIQGGHDREKGGMSGFHHPELARPPAG